ncbi:DUF5641 domain-containing protein [Trichonephila clavipes]|nr:DUF5641 domain-containing protein [Trichonephila clavipes]
MLESFSKDLRMHLKWPTERSFTYSVFFTTVLPNSTRQENTLHLEVKHTDSTIALAWLNTPANRLKTFVANHVTKVQELTEGFQWNHVPSVLNPADLVSRGLRPCDLPNLRLWWHGPQFLEKGKLSSEETSLSPVKKCEYSKELKTGANKELKRFLKLIEDSDDNLAGFLSAEDIEWKFIPPRAPSFGGLWEVSVKSIKYHLSRVVSDSNLTYEEFLTVCIQIEGILNSRPLCVCALYRAIRMT